jgi:predicted 2-oxoglutarate/Fe(II)-dependent dioxygenase YbiX
VANGVRPLYSSTLKGSDPTLEIVHIFIAEHAMDDATCRRIQAAMDVGVREPTEVIEDDMALADDVRRASHIEVPSVIFELIDAHLDAQRHGVEAFFEWELDGREGVNLLRYESGGFYKPHVDRADLPAWPPAARRAVTVVLFLESSRDADPAGGFSGGILRLFPDGEDEPIDIIPKRGMLVAFSADTPHEVTPVITGHRDTIVDWFS